MAKLCRLCERQTLAHCMFLHKIHIFYFISHFPHCERILKIARTTIARHSSSSVAESKWERFIVGCVRACVWRILSHQSRTILCVTRDQREYANHNFIIKINVSVFARCAPNGKDETKPKKKTKYYKLTQSVLVYSPFLSSLFAIRSVRVAVCLCKWKWAKRKEVNKTRLIAHNEDGEKKESWAGFMVSIFAFRS